MNVIQAYKRWKIQREIRRVHKFLLGLNERMIRAGLRRHERRQILIGIVKNARKIEKIAQKMEG